MSTALAPPSVGLIAACDDPQLFGVPLTPDQRVRLEAVEHTRLNVWAVGRRGLKTTSAAYVGLWSCLLRPELLTRLRPGERGFAVAVATSLRQARLIVSVARAVVERSPLLAGLIEAVTEDELLFANGTGFAAFPCTSRGGRGWPIHTLLLDELAHFVDGEGSNVAAETVYRALTPATAQFGADARIIASSTPWGATGLFAELYAKAESGEMADAVAHHATTQQANPSISQEFLEAEERRDPESFRAEYGAQFIGSGGAFFDFENVSACVTLPGELGPEDGVRWVAGLDPAFSSDPFACVLVGRTPDRPRMHGDSRLLVGLVRSWLPPRRKAASLDEQRAVEDSVLAEVASVVRRYGATVVLDQYRAAGIIDRLRRYGILARSIAMTAPTKDAAFGFTRSRVNEGSIEMYEHPDLLRELRAVRTRYAAGRSSVVLPRIGGSHCDLAQALAIAVLRHDQHGSGEGSASIEWDTGAMVHQHVGTSGTFGYGAKM